MSSLDNLPSDVLIYITKNLEPIDLYNLMYVNRYFNKECKNKDIIIIMVKMYCGKIQTEINGSQNKTFRYNISISKTEVEKSLYVFKNIICTIDFSLKYIQKPVYSNIALFTIGYNMASSIKNRKLIGLFNEYFNKYQESVDIEKQPLLQKYFWNTIYNNTINKFIML